ncbi:MAG: TonB family protein [Burkholderiales bacterium]|nr:TonB family protein [Burkholderiales bacterium]
MNKVAPRTEKHGDFRKLRMVSILSLMSLVTACQKAPEPDASASETSAPEHHAPMPTGLVKNPVKHTEETADVTKWMDMASTKTPAQIAKEEKLAKEAKEAKEAREAKEAKEAKLAQESRAQAAKAAALYREASKASASATTAPVAAKPVVAAAAPAPAPAVASVAALSKPAAAPVPPPENIVLKVLSSVKPSFPKSAIRSGVTEGFVNARVHVGTDGKVAQVDILKAKPGKYFDKEVIAAVMQWKYAPISKPQTALLEFNFKMD